ncbi:MAG: hypothetical protein LBQ63_04720 [Deltaproteobacteria bacterium]|nr:hypothetical protein [Deltaproteobacteria bacterium]
MTTFLALTGVIALCCLFALIFKPRYGSFRCCAGQALQSAMEEEQKKKDAQAREAEAHMRDSKGADN